MRRILILLGAAILGGTLLGAVPAAALEPTWIFVNSSEPLLNENGDGYWDTAVVSVGTHADAAHWVLTTADRVVAEGDLTPDQLTSADVGNARVLVNSTTAGGPLAAGTYTFTLTATKAGKESASDSVQLYVSTAPALTSYVPSAAVIYPNDIYDDVAHGVTFRHRLDATIVEWGAPMFEVLGPEGIVIGPWSIDPRDPLLRWDGKYQPIWGGDFVTAPAGTYWARLVLHDPSGNQRRGPLSQPFRVSRGYRVYHRTSITRLANATRTATLTRRHARFSIRDGRFSYRRTSHNWRSRSVVRTAHRVRLPAGRIPGTWPALIIRGRWHDSDVGLELVTPTGKVRTSDVWDETGPGYRLVSIPPSLIAADGTVRLRLVWSTNDSTYPVGRVDSVAVRINRWAWRGLP